MTEFTIPRDAWAEFAARIAKLNKRAAKLGCDPIVVTRLGETLVEREHHSKIDGETHVKVFKCPAIVVDVAGKAPQVQGFAFIAKIEYLSDGKSTLFHTVPGCDTKIDERFRSLNSSVCEHCNKARRRVDTFVVLNTATGEQKQIGRNCLADYTGSDSPERIAQKASWLVTCEDLGREFDGYWGAAMANMVDTRHALALTSAYITRFGWVPKSSQRADFTAGLVHRHFGNYKLSDAEIADCRTSSALIKDEPLHFERADRTIEWIKALSPKSDYEHNLVTLVVNELTEDRHLGIVCSAVAAYQRAINQAFERTQKAQARKDSKHIGQVGERLKGIKAKVEFLRFMESNWGASTLVKFIDDAGNVLTWFATGDREYRVGEDVILTATVKRHSEYNGIKETQLTRARVA